MNVLYKKIIMTSCVYSLDVCSMFLHSLFKQVYIMIIISINKQPTGVFIWSNGNLYFIKNN